MARVLQSSCKVQVKGNLKKIVKEAVKKYKPILNMTGYSAPALDTVRVAFIGVGNRGSAAVERMSRIEGVRIQGICDVRPEKANAAKKRIQSDGHQAKLYTAGDTAWKDMCSREDVDLVYIATHWQT